MAQLNQLGEVPVVVLACKNTSGSDMASGIGVIADTYVSGQISVKLPTGSGTSFPLGFTMEAIANGKVGRVMTQGIAIATSNGTISAGTPVMLDVNGKVIAQTTGLYQVGATLQDSVAADAVNVLIAQAKNA